MKLYISQGKLDELANWEPDGTGLIATLAATQAGADSSAHLTIFSVSTTCGLDEKMSILRALQDFCSVWRNTILIPAFASYRLAERRFDELYEKNYRQILSVCTKTVYDIRSITPNGVPVKILNQADSKNFEDNLRVNQQLEDNFRAHLERLRTVNNIAHGRYVNAGIRQIRLPP